MPRRKPQPIICNHVEEENHNETCKKVCTKCKDLVKLKNFHNSKRASDGYDWWCKSCRAILRKSYTYVPEPYEKRRAKNLKDKFDMSVTQYESILESQNYHCLFCDKTEKDEGRKLAVDHCHACGEIRGLLCLGHNTIFGKIEKNLNSILDYLLPHQHGENDAF